jgi:hypothetical protein
MTLQEYLAQMPDPRRAERRRYELTPLLIGTILAIACGGRRPAVSAGAPVPGRSRCAKNAQTVPPLAVGIFTGTGRALPDLPW